MKKVILIFAFFTAIACKKTEINPCYLLQWETTTTYDVGNPKRYDYPMGHTITGDSLVCNITAESLADLLKKMNGTTKADSVCITIHTVAKKQNTKTK